MYINNGNQIRYSKEEQLFTTDTLPIAWYRIGVDKYGPFLYQIPEISIPNKLYGTIKEKADKIITTFADRVISTGILLSGDKGNGKSLLAKLVCQQLINCTVPVIIIDNNFKEDTGSVINLIKELPDTCVIYFDEFEKFFDKDNQNEILPLFDNGNTNKKLFIFTINDERGIVSQFVNRPGRVYYHFKYDKIENDLVSEYLNDKLIISRKECIPDIVNFIKECPEFNFDMLMAVTEELNRYENESLTSIIDNLNITKQTENNFIWSIFCEDTKYPTVRFKPSSYRGNLLNDENHWISFYPMDNCVEQCEGYHKDTEISLNLRSDIIAGFDYESDFYLYEIDDFIIKAKITNKRKYSNYL